jgi:hypothetical protein
MLLLVTSCSSTMSVACFFMKSSSIPILVLLAMPLIFKVAIFYTYILQGEFYRGLGAREEGGGASLPIQGNSGLCIGSCRHAWECGVVTGGEPDFVASYSVFARGVVSCPCPLVTF